MKTILSGTLFVAALALAACKSDASAEKADAENPNHGLGASTVADRPADATPGAPTPAGLRVGEGPRFGGLGTVKKILLPPAKPGESVSQVQGCLASPAPSESDGAAYPAPAAGARSAPAKEDFVVVPTGGGVIVEHPLAHACCLKATVASRLEGDILTVTETLSGEPCRCRCASKVKTAVGLPRGAYTVKLEVDEAGQRRHVGEQGVVIP